MPLDGATQTVKLHRLHENCTGLILAVSGGPDSMAMLHWYARKNPAFPLYVAHVHHGLRPESDEEESTVVAYCNALSLPCSVFRTDVRAEMQKRETVESAARRIRYGFFRTLAAQVGASHIATAHTGDDQCETILLHLLHGAGGKGLCGILPKRPEGDFTLIRPFLDCGKEEILAYCEEHGIPYAVDQSNDELTYTRNRIRHLLLPEMKKINPNLRRSLCNTAQGFRRQHEALSLRAKQFLDAHPDGLPATELRALPEGEQGEILRQAFEKFGKTLSFEQTNQGLALLKKETGTVEFDRKYQLHLGQDLLTVSEKSQPFPPILITEETALLPDGRTLTLTKAVCDEKNRNSLIPAKLPLTARPRQVGDTLRTPGGSKTLKKRMIELKIPSHKRDKLWVLTDGATVFWCEGVGFNPETAPKETEEGYFISLSEK
ncbi:MAG: tRNA lysidine(34) synthetase TilS [Clostridia bacterium]|nr:tRNA lysidine(34) synthetase TilS [Clostridia bacterium]